MADIVLWGTGKVAERIFKAIHDRIILVVDNNENKWGCSWNGHVVSAPAMLASIKGKFDKIVIATYSWKSIREQIINEFQIEANLIDNMYYRQKAALLKKYENRESDKENYISYLKEHPLTVFNHDFTNHYENKEDITVFFDELSSLYYVFHCGKKMYFSREYCSEDDVKGRYCSMLMEQDARSPHRYQTEGFHVCQGDVVLDAGVAEGNFALEVIDLADKVYLVEADRDWIEALQHTFGPYKDKVEIIEGFIGNDGLQEISIDSVFADRKLDFIKMDIEGAEVRALHGARKTLERNNVKLDICAYHNVDDEEQIKEVLKEIGYQTEVSEGYMVFLTDCFDDKDVVCPEFVKGLVRGYKAK